MHRVPVTLLGVSLTLQTEDDPEKLRKTVAYYESKLEEVAKSIGTHEALKLSLVTGLVLAEEALFRPTVTNDEMERITQNLIDRIDQVL